MSIRERIGVDVGDRFSVAGAVEWAEANEVPAVDVTPGRELAARVPSADAAAVRAARADAGVSLGIHTLSAVNVAAHTPFVEDAVDEYLRAAIDLAERVDADRVVVHGGYHFTADRDERIATAIERLRRTVEDAMENDATVLLENLNPEPASAEVQYVPATLDECRRFFDALPDTVAWACNPPHANLLPTGIHDFLDGMNQIDIGEVRLNDNRGTHEEHLLPGEGTIDFERLLARFEDAGYDGHYIVAQGDPAAGLEARERLLELVAG